MNIRKPTESMPQFDYWFTRQALSLPEDNPEHRLVVDWETVALHEDRKIDREKIISIAAVARDALRKGKSYPHAEILVRTALVDSGLGDYLLAVDGLSRAFTGLKGRQAEWKLRLGGDVYHNRGFVTESHLTIPGLTSTKDLHVRVSYVAPETGQGTSIPFERMRELNILPTDDTRRRFDNITKEL